MMDTCKQVIQENFCRVGEALQEVPCRVLLPDSIGANRVPRGVLLPERVDLPSQLLKTFSMPKGLLKDLLLVSAVIIGTLAVTPVEAS
mmetsp:Transcript_10974/g.26052  ORF Transcript_10974/g.26052 Transcript_10974/m.26052 type:complete len:88 (-) Transcript_10974:613-876(-)